MDNLEQLLTNAEIEKGKHKAVLEAALDAKQIVEEDSTPGLNAHDAIKTFGPAIDWAKVNSVCYNTSITQAATGCMEFDINGRYLKNTIHEQFCTVLWTLDISNNIRSSLTFFLGLIPVWVTENQLYRLVFNEAHLNKCRIKSLAYLILCELQFTLITVWISLNLNK